MPKLYAWVKYLLPAELRTMPEAGTVPATSELQRAGVNLQPVEGGKMIIPIDGRLQ